MPRSRWLKWVQAGPCMQVWINGEHLGDMDFQKVGLGEP